MKRLLAALLFLTACVLIPAPAGAAACSGTSGVTVVVDFDNGTILTRCASGDPASGYAALTAAGFSLDYAQGSGQGALCSINNVPDHPCPSMPPADAYWAYFHASRGGTWAYSNLGGDAYDPKPGSVEGWHFRGSPSSPPGIAPPAAEPTPTYTPSRLPVIPPPASSTRSPGTKPPATATATALVPTAGATGGAAGLGVPTAPGGGVPTSAPTPTVGSTSDSAAAATVGKSTTQTSTPAHHGGGLPWIWGVVLVAVLATAGALGAVRRKRA